MPGPWGYGELPTAEHMPPVWAADAARDSARVERSCLQTGKLSHRLPNRASSSCQMELEMEWGLDTSGAGGPIRECYPFGSF